MKTFKGFDDWIEIFAGGKQIDSNGIEHDGDTIIAQAIETFKPSYHEPPLVAGHPVDNSPAFGWVSGLKKTGNSLFAKFSQVVPEFSKACETGMFKKRSASFYPDGRLRHVGFLGAMPPAVKGLADLSFSDDDKAWVFEFSEADSWTWETVGGIFRKMRDYFIEKEGKEKADRIIPDWDVEYIRDMAKNNNKEDDMKFAEFLEAFKFWKKIEGGSDMDLPIQVTKPVSTFSEADIEQAKKDGVAAEREKLDAEFAEKGAQVKRKAAEKEIADFCDTLVASGKIPPSWVDSGLVGFMQTLDAEKEISFSEDSKKSSRQWFRDYLEGFSKSKLFQELAKKEKAGDSAEFAESKQQQEAGESIAAKVNG